MNTYYTAKDIEELAASGTTQLVLGPGVFLTDYARETAQQLGIALVRSESQAVEKKPAACLPKAKPVSDKYNKPRGCQPSLNSQPTQAAQASTPSGQSNGASAASDDNTINRLIDLMGKVIKRGS